MPSPVGSPSVFIPAVSSPREEIPLTGQATVKRDRSEDSDTSRSSEKAPSHKKRRGSVEGVMALVARQTSGLPSHAAAAGPATSASNVVSRDVPDVASRPPASSIPSAVESASSRRRLLISASSDLAFMVDLESPSEPLTQSLFAFHEEAMKCSTTYQTLIRSAEQFGRIAIDMSEADILHIPSQWSWDEELSFHDIQLFRKGIEKAVEVIPPDERDEAMEIMGIHWLVNELNNAAVKNEFDALNQAARNGEFADKTLESDTDRQLARHDNDGPAVHYARELERLERTFVEKLDAIRQEIHVSHGGQTWELTPRPPFEEAYQELVDLGHAQLYLPQYDLFAGKSSE